MFWASPKLGRAFSAHHEYVGAMSSASWADHANRHERSWFAPERPKKEVPYSPLIRIGEFAASCLR
jgi:hypothetical protein